MDFFKILSLPTDFLEVPVNLWKDMDSYKHAKHIVSHLKVVNDHAERAVKLMTDYNRIITKKEQNYQELLISVEEHRRSLPSVTKNNLNEKYKL